MTHCSVARGDVVKAMPEPGLWTADGIGHRAASNQPHDQLDPLAPRFAHVVDVRRFRETPRVVNQTVQKTRVPLAIDQPCSWPLQLMTHAARTPDLDIQVGVKALDSS